VLLDYYLLYCPLQYNGGNIMTYMPPSLDANGAWNPSELLTTPEEEHEMRLRFLDNFLMHGVFPAQEEYAGFWFEAEHYFSREERKLLSKIENNASESLWDSLTIDMLEKALALVATTNYGRIAA